MYYQRAAGCQLGDEVAYRGGSQYHGGKDSKYVLRRVTPEQPRTYPHNTRKLCSIVLHFNISYLTCIILG